ncbi:hypothetical protein Tco_0089668 [Tanacetum coccineum]
MDEKRHRVPTESYSFYRMDWNDPRSEVERETCPIMIPKRKLVGTRRKHLQKEELSDKQVEDKLKVTEEENESYPIVNWEYQVLGRMEMKDMEAYKKDLKDRSLEDKGINTLRRFEDVFDPIIMLVRKSTTQKESGGNDNLEAASKEKAPWHLSNIQVYKINKLKRSSKVFERILSIEEDLIQRNLGFECKS